MLLHKLDLLKKWYTFQFPEMVHFSFPLTSAQLFCYIIIVSLEFRYKDRKKMIFLKKICMLLISLFFSMLLREGGLRTHRKHGRPRSNADIRGGT